MLIDHVPAGTPRRSPLWDAVLRLPEPAREEARYWCARFAGRPAAPFRAPERPAVLRLSASDGSETGGGGVMQMEDGTVLRLRYDWLGRRWQVDGLYD